METQSIRPTKKQRELLSYIEGFIAEHGYSPSYREIMNGLDYTSVATVSLHVNSLIRRGHLRKRDRSARSLEVVHDSESPHASETLQSREEQWLIDKVEQLVKQLETAAEVSTETLNDLHILVGSLRVLGLETVAETYNPRLEELGKKAE